MNRTGIHPPKRAEPARTQIATAWTRLRDTWLTVGELCGRLYTFAPGPRRTGLPARYSDIREHG